MAAKKKRSTRRKVSPKKPNLKKKPTKKAKPVSHKTEAGVWDNQRRYRTSRSAYNQFLTFIAENAGVPKTTFINGGISPAFRSSQVKDRQGLNILSLRLKKSKLNTLLIYQKGLKELLRVMEDNRLLTIILIEAWNKKVKPVLEERLVLPTKTERTKAGSTVDITEEASGKRPIPEHRRSESLRTKTDNIRRMLTDVRVLGTRRVGDASMSALLTGPQVTIQGTSSKFNKAFLIWEFGTGRFAKPGPRPYQSFETTPYKVPSSPFGDSMPGDFFTSLKDAKDFQKYLAGYDRHQKIMSDRRYGKKSKTASRALLDKTDPAKILERAKKGREGIHAIFDVRTGNTVALAIREALDAANKYAIKLINKEVAKAVPGWANANGTSPFITWRYGKGVVSLGI